MQIWPAIDLLDGKCVRLRQGDYGRKTVYSDDPVATALRWREAGARHLHLVDLDGARDGRLSNRSVIDTIVSSIGIECEVGGGVRDEATIRDLITLGVSRVVVGTRALRDPDWFDAMCQEFPGRLVLGIDARNGQVATDGWIETSTMAAVELARRFSAQPLAAIIYTDIATDGMLSGPNLSEMKALLEAVEIPIVASGGIRGLEDIQTLAEIPVAGAIVGRAIYDGGLDLRAAVELASAYA